MLVHARHDFSHRPANLSFEFQLFKVQRWSNSRDEHGFNTYFLAKDDILSCWNTLTNWKSKIKIRKERVDDGPLKTRIFLKIVAKFCESSYDVNLVPDIYNLSLFFFSFSLITLPRHHKIIFLSTYAEPKFKALCLHTNLNLRSLWRLPKLFSWTNASGLDFVPLLRTWISFSRTGRNVKT